MSNGTKEDFSFLAGSSEAEVKEFFNEHNRTTLEDLDKRIDDTQEMISELNTVVSKIHERIEQFVLAIIGIIIIFLLKAAWHWFKG